MKKIIVGFLLSACILAVAFSAFAANPKPCCGLPVKQPAVAGAAVGSDVKTYADCKYCGLSREKFSFSRILIEYDDGTVIGLCSIHCAAVDLAIQLDRTPQSIKVGEYTSGN